MLSIHRESNKKLRLWVYLASFLFTLNIALTAYINSSFIEQLTNQNSVGIFFAIASTLSIIILLVLPKIIYQVGVKHILLIATTIVFGAVVATSLGTSWVLVLLSLLVFRSLSTIIPYLLDIYLESLSDDQQTGTIRGLFLLMINLSWILSAWLIGQILTTDPNYQAIYLWSSLSLVPFIALILLTFKPVKIPTDHLHSSVLTNLKQIIFQSNQTNANLKNILGLDFVLNFFYALMVIYTPIYLHSTIGLGWGEISLVFTIMLLPFLLLEYPLGLIADKWLGEKEIMVLGVLIAGLTTILISFIPDGGLVIWAIVLFMTRVGAASIEISKETYLFKTIDAGDTKVLSIFRMMVPVSYLVAPLLASAFLFYFDFKFLFMALGLVTLVAGLSFSLKLKDTQ